MTEIAEELVDEQPEDGQPSPNDDDVPALQRPAAEKPPLDVREIPLDQIGERANIRPAYHGLDKLAETMHLQGQLQPCVVRPSPSDAEHDKPFELIFGHRRKRAAEMLGWETLRCEVRDVPDHQRVTQLIVENYQREQHSPTAEARAMLQLQQENGWSQARIARELGCDPSHVSHRLSLLSLAIPTPPPAPPPAPLAEDVSEPGVEAPVQDGAVPEGQADEQLPVVAEADADAAATEDGEAAEEERPRVDILALVDEGRLSASAAEVIVGIGDREAQEKTAVLAARYEWPVKKIEQYARKLKQQEEVFGPEEMGAVEVIKAEDVVDLRRLPLRPDLSDEDYDRLDLLALLRQGMDNEMLEFIDERLQYTYDELWSYVALLDAEQVGELRRRLLRRYASAAHRFHSWTPDFVDYFAVSAEADPELLAEIEQASALELPGAAPYELPAYEGEDEGPYELPAYDDDVPPEEMG